MALDERLVLDSGAVIALARNDARARSVLHAAWEAGARVSIPVVVLAETVRGRPDDAPVNRIVKAVGDYIEVTEPDGRTTGHLLGETGMSSTIDAIVVACTDRTGGGAILTGDAGDLRQLVAGNASIRIVPL